MVKWDDPAGEVHQRHWQLSLGPIQVIPYCLLYSYEHRSGKVMMATLTADDLERQMPDARQLLSDEPKI